jgi:hypothetical protein
VVQRRNASYAFVSLLLLLLAPRNVCLSLLLDLLAPWKYSLLRVSRSLLLVRVCMHFSLSLFCFCHSWESCSLLGELLSLSVYLSPLLVLLARRKISILLVLLAPFLSPSLASPPPSKLLLNVCSFSTPSLFCLPFLFLRLCSTLSGDTTTDFPMCSTLSVESPL